MVRHLRTEPWAGKKPMKRLITIASCCVASAAAAQITVPTDPSSLHWDRPTKTRARASVPLPAASAFSPGGTAAETLDNDQIVMLSRAGLGPEAIIAKINSTRGTYQTSTGALIALKRAGVPDPVIAAMLSRSGAPALANGLAGNANVDPLSPHAPGIYMLDRAHGGRMMRIDATVSNQMKSSGVLGFALSYGLASMKMKTVIPNPSARARTTEHRPVFYFYFDQAGPLASFSQFGSSFSPTASSPNEFSLIRFDEKRDHREAAVGSYNIGGVKTGVSDKARVGFTYDDVAPGVFKVTPTAELPPGEYGFVSSIGAGTGMGGIARIFDFAVG